MLDGVIPVVVVDTFRDDDEGSIYGINAFSLGAVNGFPSVSFGSAVNDWECISITSVLLDRNSDLVHPVRAHLFTPIFPYNPATTVNPVGFFTPGIIGNRAFTFGTVVGIGGSNPLLPGIFGIDLNGRNDSGIGFTPLVPGINGEVFRPPVPLRIYRDVTLTIQFNGVFTPGRQYGLEVTMLYRERPKVSA